MPAHGNENVGCEAEGARRERVVAALADAWLGGDHLGMPDCRASLGEMADAAIAAYEDEEGMATPERSPHELHRQAAGDRDEYLRLMVEHGHLVPKDRCASCGVSKQNVLAMHEEVRLKLVAMTEARDLCKRQTADVERARQRLGRGFNGLMEHIHGNEHAGPRLGCPKCQALEAGALTDAEPEASA